MASSSELDPVRLESVRSLDLPFPSNIGSDRFFQRLTYGLGKGVVLGLVVEAGAVALRSFLDQTSPIEFLIANPNVLPAAAFGVTCLAVGKGIIEVLKS